MVKSKILTGTFLAAFTLFWGIRGSTLSAEEGMYLPGGLPLETLQTRYGFSPTPEWLNLLQRASVRFPNGSGSFVSSQGMVFTNHHIALDCVEKLSSKQDNLVENGFVATSQGEEKKVP